LTILLTAARVKC